MNLTENKNVIKDAATVILIRPSNSGDWEIFLARRHHNQTFMAGAYVFPGGQLEETDNDPLLKNHIKTADVFDPCRLLQDGSLSGEKARGFFHRRHQGNFGRGRHSFRRQNHRKLCFVS